MSGFSLDIIMNNFSTLFIYNNIICNQCDCIVKPKEENCVKLSSRRDKFACQNPSGHDIIETA